MNLQMRGKMNQKGESNIISVLALIFLIIGAYGSLAYFLINTKIINETTAIFHMKFMYFLISLLFGAIVILYVLVLNKNKSEGKKKK